MITEEDHDIVWDPACYTQAVRLSKATSDPQIRRDVIRGQCCVTGERGFRINDARGSEVPYLNGLQIEKTHLIY